MTRLRLLAGVLLLGAGCAVTTPSAGTDTRPSVRESTTTVVLHGTPLELHLATPAAQAAPDVLVIYASGDGGWFGAAVDMFRQIPRAGTAAAGFSSRAFLKVARPHGALVSAAQLAADYAQIVTHARLALGLGPATRTVLTGWSRGAAFSVLVGTEPAPGYPVAGVVAIGLAEGEDLAIDGAEDETDDGQPSSTPRHWPFDTYALVARLGPLPCAVIQATHDNYLPAERARSLFGPDSPSRRFYAVEARNHRFSGGRAAFDAAWLDALRWIVAAPAATPVVISGESTAGWSTSSSNDRRRETRHRGVPLAALQ